MQLFQNQTATASGGAGRRVALLVAALALGAAAASVGGAAAANSPVAVENATADAEPRVVDATVHDLDDGRAVLVVVVETGNATETVVTELDGKLGGADSSDAEPAQSPDTIDLPNGSVDGLGLPNATGGGFDLSNASSDLVAADNLTDIDGVAGATPNGSTGSPSSPGSISGDLVDGALLDVPDALRSPPERLTRAVSREPAFGGGWLLPGALAALGGAMATLGVGALAIWRRTF